MAFNPFDFQRQMFMEFEKTMGEYLQKTMRDPEFMKLMAKGMDGALDYRGAMKTQIEATLKTLQLPTEASQEKLYQTLHGMETRVLDLEEEVQGLRATLLDALTASTMQMAAVQQMMRQMNELMEMAAKVVEQPAPVASAEPEPPASAEPAPVTPAAEPKAPAPKKAASRKKGGSRG